jgi:hypothetical protein
MSENGTLFYLRSFASIGGPCVGKPSSLKPEIAQGVEQPLFFPTLNRGPSARLDANPVHARSLSGSGIGVSVPDDLARSSLFMNSTGFCSDL